MPIMESRLPAFVENSLRPSRSKAFPLRYFERKHAAVVGRDVKLLYQMEVAWQLVKNPLQTVSRNDNWPQLLQPFISPSGEGTGIVQHRGEKQAGKHTETARVKPECFGKHMPQNKSFLMLCFFPPPSSALVLNFPFSTDQHKLKANIGMERKDGESWPFPSGGQPQIPAVVWEMMSYSLETWLRSFGVTGKLFRRFSKTWNMSSFFPPFF